MLVHNCTDCILVRAFDAAVPQPAQDARRENHRRNAAEGVHHEITAAVITTAAPLTVDTARTPAGSCLNSYH